MKKTENMTRDEAGRRAVRNMTAVIITGIVLMAADMIMFMSEPQVTLYTDKAGSYLVRPDGSGEVEYFSLKARVYGGDDVYEKKTGASIEPYGSGKTDSGDDTDEEGTDFSRQELMDSQITGIVSAMNSDTGEKKVKLPQSLKSGEKVVWEIEKKRNTDVFLIAAVTAAAVFAVYRKRFYIIERQKKKEHDSVMRQLPEFVNRLVLLLNAGLVLTSAFERAVEESFMSSADEDDYFYSRLRDIYASCRTANGSVHIEFRNMARDSGVRELMRVSNIISDNIKKGVQLTDKLQAESEMLWNGRKKDCEEKGRLAETKLTLPLMIFLLVLIVITVSPVMLEI